MTAASEGVREANPLVALLARCVVRIDCDGAFAATGFFVAPGEIVTCAHVVHGCERVSVLWEGGEHPVGEVAAVPELAPGDAAFYPLPDVALLRLDDPPEHPCVRLDERLPALDDVLRLCAFTASEHAPGEVVRSAASTAYEGTLAELDATLLKLRDGQILGGFSGGPLLHVGGGGVCGVVESSRDERSGLGGFGVPAAAVLAAFDGLRERNVVFHEGDERWARAVEAEDVAATRRASGFHSLPLRSGAAPALAKDASPSAVLLPRRRVVPLVGREDLLAQFMLWRERDDPLSIAIVAGAGGYGKTRLAAELCLAAQDAGWTAGLFDPPDRAEREGQAIDDLAAWPGRLLVAIDYAETRPDLVNELLHAVQRYPDRPPVRVVLVVRQAGTRTAMRDLFVTRRASEELGDLYDAAWFVNLDARVHAVDRGELFEHAMAALAKHFETGPYAGRIPRLRAKHFDRPLYVLVAASLAVRDAELDPDALSERELLLALLDAHEASYWERWDAKLGVGLQDRDRPVAVALAGLLGSSSEEETLALVRLVPGLDDATQERVRLAGRWLGSLYGAGDLDAIAPLEPDRLAEVLIGHELADAATIGAALDAATPGQLVRALNVLARAAGEHEPLRVAARAALDERLADIARDLASSAPTDMQLVAALRLVLQATRPLAGALAAARELSEPGLSLRPLAVDVSELAVAAARALVEADAERFLPDLAASLVYLFAGLSGVGRAGDALVAIEEAVEHYRVLAAAGPERFLPELAMSLNNLSNVLSEVGRAGDGLVAIEEAVERYRVLAAASPERFLPELAMSLNNLSNGLSDVGRANDALVAIEEAVKHRRVLAAASPERFLPELATSLNNLSNGLSDVGRAGDALLAIEEAVKHRRVLAAASPERFLPDLARSMSNLATRLSEVERGAEASRLYAEVLAAQEDDWCTGVLRLSRAWWRRGTGDIQGVIADGWDVAQRIGVLRDARRRGEARNLLCAMRTDDPQRFDDAWAIAVQESQPGWLVHLDDDEVTVERLTAWVETGSWEASEAALAEHAATLLTDPAEATLEHLVDANPGHGALVMHLGILQAARAHGIAETYADLRSRQRRSELAGLLNGWLPLRSAEGRAFVEEHAEALLTDEAEGMLEAAAREGRDARLVAALGLLGLCRLDGVTQAYALLDGDAERAPVDGEPRRSLALARLKAGTRPGDAELHADHAVAAAAHGKPEEEAAAIAACRDAADPWERGAIKRRLKATADERPELADEIAALIEALSAPA